MTNTEKVLTKKQTSTLSDFILFTKSAKSAIFSKVIDMCALEAEKSLIKCQELEIPEQIIQGVLERLDQHKEAYSIIEEVVTQYLELQQKEVHINQLENSIVALFSAYPAILRYTEDEVLTLVSSVIDEYIYIKRDKPPMYSLINEEALKTHIKEHYPLTDATIQFVLDMCNIIADEYHCR